MVYGCGYMNERDARAMKAGKDQVHMNYEMDNSYAPYCLRCNTMMRMRPVGPYQWRCHKCPGRADLSEEHEKFIHRDAFAWVEAKVKDIFASRFCGHDWEHIDRVRRTAVAIAIEEKANTEIVELAALMHDIGDRKLWPDMPNQAEVILSVLGGCELLTLAQKHRIATTAAAVSFKGATVPDEPPDLETKCVMDADRLDAMGAIGIARCFAYGGSKNRPIFDPAVPPQRDQTEAQYKDSNSSSINHFFEKLLLLKNRLQTQTGHQMGARRHQVMVDFLHQFSDEWGASVFPPAEPVVDRNMVPNEAPAGESTRIADREG